MLVRSSAPEPGCGCRFRAPLAGPLPLAPPPAGRRGGLHLCPLGAEGTESVTFLPITAAPTSVVSSHREGDHSGFLGRGNVPGLCPSSMASEGPSLAPLGRIASV